MTKKEIVKQISDRPRPDPAEDQGYRAANVRRDRGYAHQPSTTVSSCAISASSKSRSGRPARRNPAHRRARRCAAQECRHLQARQGDGGAHPATGRGRGPGLAGGGRVRREDALPMPTAKPRRVRVRMAANSRSFGPRMTRLPNRAGRANFPDPQIPQVRSQVYFRFDRYSLHRVRRQCREAPP